MIRLRLSDVAPAGFAQGNGKPASPFGSISTDVLASSPQGGRRVLRRRHSRVRSNADEANVMRQALAGMLWSKQFYHYDVDKWLEERGSDPFKADAQGRPRNDHWHHMYNGDIISMPDKWEYPWYAAWDLAFHVLALTLVDPDFGKQQLKLMLRERYMHPNGQIPAYEWNFGDVNPPVHAWSTIFTYRLEKAQEGRGRHGLAQELLPEAAARTSPGGSTARTAPAATSSRAASWGSTTSACSTAARRCRPAATWSRPTARPGWPSSARTCWKSPSNWR